MTHQNDLTEAKKITKKGSKQDQRWYGYWSTWRCKRNGCHNVPILLLFFSCFNFLFSFMVIFGFFFCSFFPLSFFPGAPISISPFLILYNIVIKNITKHNPMQILNQGFFRDFYIAFKIIDTKYHPFISQGSGRGPVWWDTNGRMVPGTVFCGSGGGYKFFVKLGKICKSGTIWKIIKGLPVTRSSYRWFDEWDF